MARARARRVSLVANEFRRRRGFTLVELLVVLAILVILFGLLFAPMMTSLDMARQGQSRAKMQDTVRYAMEDIRRTVGNAIYVLPPHIIIPALWDPANPTVNQPVPDLTTLTVVEPRRDSVTRLLMNPLQPEVRVAPYDPAATPQPWMAAVRYTVHPKSGRTIRYEDSARDSSLQNSEGHTISVSESISPQTYEPRLEDPFALYRQTGIWYRVSAGPPEVWAFGSFDRNRIFLPNRPISENALTGVDGYDVQCASSICDNCGADTPGFRPYTLPCATCSATAGYSYQFDGVRFAPQRVAGEQLKERDDGTVYYASHAGWTGYTHSDSATTCPDLDPRQLDPRIRIWRYRSSTGAYDELQFDTIAGGARGTPTLDLAWDKDTGAIRFGHLYEQIITLPDPGGGIWRGDPAKPEDQAAVSSLDPAGVIPTGYRIDTYGTSPVCDPAIILPSTVKVRAVVNLGSGANARKWWWDFVRTDQYQQEAIGPWQFAVRRSLPPSTWAPWLPRDWATSMDILFNTFLRKRPDGQYEPDPAAPPGVPRFETIFGTGNVSSVEIHILYWARRNADIFTRGGILPSGRDDIVRVDYNTRDTIDVNLKVSGYVDYMDDGTGNLAMPAPPPQPRQASLTDTIIVRNAAR